MKKRIAIILLSFAFLAAAETSFAKNSTFNGQIMLVDKARNEIIVKDKASGVDKTFTVDAAQITSLEPGNQVNVSFKEGSLAAQKVEIEDQGQASN